METLEGYFFALGWWTSCVGGGDDGLRGGVEGGGVVVGVVVLWMVCILTCVCVCARFPQLSAGSKQRGGPGGLCEVTLDISSSRVGYSVGELLMVVAVVW